MEKNQFKQHFAIICKPLTQKNRFFVYQNIFWSNLPCLHPYTKLVIDVIHNLLSY